ncbi:Protein of unknown function [Chryseobacterium sp. RU37D]|uniref:RsiV family protein n=1 Tax=Chryseobacterium sp. RU37D TaxID=1907397 RepID=UPI0009540E43|nr:RsiV family protein [Chryseobacterium sp. RU37D]SIQ45134.1 Protein of unknown function [Chryseobacterium sp. RU37D]
MKKYTKATLLSGLLLMTLSCSKKENLEQKTQEGKMEGFPIDSISLNDSEKIFDSVTMNYSSKLLIFPSLKDKKLLDSIYFDKKGLADFSKKGLTDVFGKETDAYFGSVKNNQKKADTHYKQTWERISKMTEKSFVNDYLHIQYSTKVLIGKTQSTLEYQDRVFDIKNNTKVQLSDITTASKEKLSQLLEKNFDKNEKKIKFADLTMKKISPNNNFYFDDKNLYFHYNLDVFMPGYPMGDVVVPVPLEELKADLTPAFKERMKIK